MSKAEKIGSHNNDKSSGIWEYGEQPDLGNAKEAAGVSRRDFVKIGVGILIAAAMGGGGAAIANMIKGENNAGSTTGDQIPSTEVKSNVEDFASGKTESQLVESLQSLDGQKELSVSQIENFNDIIKEFPIDRQIELLRIPSNLSTEELANLIVDVRFVEWTNFGSRDGLSDDSMAANESWDDYLPGIVKQGKNLFTKAMFVDNWESDSSLKKAADNYSSYNDATLGDYAYTKWNTYHNCTEGFAEWEKVTKIISSEIKENGDRTIVAGCRSYNNSQQGTGKNYIENQKSDVYTEVTLGLKKAGDHYLIDYFEEH